MVAISSVGESLIAFSIIEFDVASRAILCQARQIEMILSNHRTWLRDWERIDTGVIRPRSEVDETNHLILRSNNLESALRMDNGNPAKLGLPVSLWMSTV